MNPAPPVIMIFLTSGSGSNLVLPVRIGASFQMPVSSSNLAICDREKARGRESFSSKSRLYRGSQGYSLASTPNFAAAAIWAQYLDCRWKVWMARVPWETEEGRGR